MVAIALSFLTAFTLTYCTLPSIIKIAHLHGLVDRPDDRKSHSTVTPSFGGIGIFTGFFIVVLVWTPPEFFDQMRFFLTSLIIVFTVGAVDDLDPISPFSKLAGQMLAITILIFLADIRVSSLYGLFGVYELPFLLSVLISSVLYIFLINSFNLIDGINGLSSSITILACSMLGLWFFITDYAVYSIIAFAVAGSSLAFLKFNVTPARIFMGDTGSLVLGTVCAALVIQFLEINNSIQGSTYAFEAGTSVALGILILPVFDTIRVFVFRILRGRSPFTPDKNHIHHLLLDLGLSHMQATSALLLVNILFIVFSLQMQFVGPLSFIGMALCIAYIGSQILSIFAHNRRSKVVRTR